MSLAATALRLSATMLLANGFTAPFPTIAGANVFDTRLDPINLVVESVLDTELAPTIVVMSDGGQGSSISENNGGFPFEMEVGLSIDLSMVGTIRDESNALVGVEEILTQTEIETRLDFLQHQIELLLTRRPGVWGAQFDAIARRITGFKVEKYYDPESGLRTASRCLEMTVLLPLDESASDLTLIDPSPVPVPAATVPGPLGSLLAAIAASASPMAATASAITAGLLAAGAGAPLVLPPLQRVRMTAAHDAELNGAGTPKGPGAAGLAQANLD